MPAETKRIITEIITPNKRTKPTKKLNKNCKTAVSFTSLSENKWTWRILPSVSPYIKQEMPRAEGYWNESSNYRSQALKKRNFSRYEIGILHSRWAKRKRKSDARFLCRQNKHFMRHFVVESRSECPQTQRHHHWRRGTFRSRPIAPASRARYSKHTSSLLLCFRGSKKRENCSRLKALKTAKNGFELAELDLVLRGAGELGGTKQWGITDLGMEAIKNMKMVEAAALRLFV